ncbi:MAG: dehydratase [Propionibacteriales bacterium]|nr:dehydratase [Propionibacteriales bacterium]
MRVFNGPDELADAVGEHLGYSDWQAVTQERITGFADATGDHQWIHVDPDRAANGPFKGTIAHGYLTLSMIPALCAQIYRVEGVSMGINYGSNKVRYPQPVPVGARVRAGAELVSLSDVPQGKQLVMRVTIELENSAKPACVAETVTLLIP